MHQCENVLHLWTFHTLGKRRFMNFIYIYIMDSEELYNVLYDKQPEQFSQILSQFLDETSDEDIQDYNTFDDLENFSRIWMIIKQI